MAAKEVVVAWLTEADIAVSDHPVEPPYDWGVLTAGNPFRILVAHRSADWPNLYLQVNIALTADHKEALRTAPDAARDAFLFDLRIALAQTPVGFNITMDDDDLPAGVFLAYNLLENPATRAGFFRRHHQLQSAGVLAVQMIKKFERFRDWRP